MAEPRTSRLKRLRMRSWRRGTREMDLLLGPFADAEIECLDAPGLDAFEALLEENDHELYRWMSGQARPAPEHAALVSRIRAHHGIS